jgi:hypothetical protein
MRYLSIFCLSTLALVSQSASAGGFSSKCTAPPFVCGASEVPDPPQPQICHPKNLTDPTPVCGDANNPPPPTDATLPKPPTKPSDLQPPPLGTTCIPRVGAPSITINKLKFCD